MRSTGEYLPPVLISAGRSRLNPTCRFYNLQVSGLLYRYRYSTLAAVMTRLSKAPASRSPRSKQITGPMHADNDHGTMDEASGVASEVDWLVRPHHSS